MRFTFTLSSVELGTLGLLILTAGYCQAAGGNVSGTVTCTGNFGVYADSVLQGTGSPEQEVTVSPSEETNLIAVECSLAGAVGGIIASFSNLYITDGSWKCSPEYQPDWQSAQFDDTLWQMASVLGQNGDEPWGSASGVAADAKWIWTSGFTGGDIQVYCRGRFGKQGRAPDSQGKEFVILFMENGGKAIAPHSNELFITTVKPYDVTVSVTTPKHPTVSMDTTLTVKAGQVQKVLVPYDVTMTGSTRGSHVIYVTGSDEITVFGVNKKDNSADAILAKPVDSLGANYYAVCSTPQERETQLAIAAAYDSTDVQIVLPQTRNLVVNFDGINFSKGRTIYITLDKFDSVQIQSAQDLTGAHVLSSRPVAVFSGNVMTNVGDGASRDHLCVQLVPVETWGKTFISTPTPGKSKGDLVRVIASESSTNINIEGRGNYRIQAPSEYIEERLDSFQMYVITATKPVLVAKIVKSQEGNDKGDPALSLVTPLALFTSDYTFLTPEYSGGGSYNNFLTVTAPYSYRTRVYLDDKFLSRSSWTRIRSLDPDMAVRTVSVRDGTHRVRHENPTIGIGVSLYGYEKYESYAFVPAMLLTPINIPCLPSTPILGDGLDNDCDGRIDEELCLASDGENDDDNDGEVDEDCAQPEPVDGVWTRWGAWLSCQECGTQSTQPRYRTCSDPAPMFDGKACEGDSVQWKNCLRNCAPVDGGWSEWGVWGACSMTCELESAPGTRQRYRSCVDPVPLDGGADCEGEGVENSPCEGLSMCPIDGGWTEWTGFSECMGTCDYGLQVNFRYCTNPAPQYGGANCEGIDAITQDCFLAPCPINGGWSEWSDWSDCSQTCDEGTRVRNRTCNNPTPQFNGTDCGTDSVETESCLIVNCPIDGDWSPWTSWSDCSATCDNGTRSRNRSCDNPMPQFNGADCAGSDTEAETCLLINCPIDGGWSEWSMWTDCSTSCDNGTRSRARSCDNPEPKYGGKDCSDDTSETEICFLVNCPVDGGWSPWTPWSDCSATCDNGTRSRNRSCDNPVPRFNGKDCADSGTGIETCLLMNCPIDGGWSAWSTWSDCSTSCDNGTISRDRSCDNPEPKYGGKNCEAPSTESQVCFLENCPVDGVWQEWSGWSECTVTCETGFSYRIRKCIEPQFGGLPCPGEASESRDCVLQPNCPINGTWSTWTSWSGCPATCGRPLNRIRTRTCNNPAPQYGGFDCGIESTQTEDCSTDCPVDGLWSTWVSWSACSATCNSATRSRTRSCDDPAPQFGGIFCNGGQDASEETADCTVPLCPVDGNWAQWSTWSLCSRSCEQGVQTRERTCTNPAPVAGGDPCAGSGSEEKVCVLQATCPPPIHGNWSQWTQWTTCSKTCGGGVSSRSRACNNPTPQHGGDFCIWSGTEDINCNDDQCPGEKLPYDVNPRNGVTGNTPYATVPPDVFPDNTYIEKDLGSYEMFYKNYSVFMNTPDFVDMKNNLNNDTIVCVNYEIVSDDTRLGAFSCPLPFEPATFTLCCGEQYAEFCCKEKDDDDDGNSNSQEAGVLALIGIILLVVLLGLMCWCCFGRRRSRVVNERFYK